MNSATHPPLLAMTPDPGTVATAVAAPVVALDRIVPPCVTTPLPTIIEALKRIVVLQGLTDAEFEWLATHCSERRREAGEVIFRDGDPAHVMTILVKGEIHVRRGAGGAIFIGRSGQITGKLPYSRMKTFGGQGFTTVPVWSLDIDESLFPEMLVAIPSMGKRCVGVLLDRVREITRMEQQAEKLNALGKLAGNLAHELNNPASAAQRAAGGLLEELRTYGHEKFKLGALCLEEDKLKRVRSWQEEVSETARLHTASDSAQNAAEEDRITRWLGDHQVEDIWHIAPELVESGIAVDRLEPLTSFLDAPALTVLLSQFASSLRAERMTRAMIDSTERIFDLITAIKDYSYMDQAPIQEIDVSQGLENTLVMLQSRLEHVTVIRDYAPDLPCINAYGSELNQVWMALLENALDAIDDHGTIQLKVQVSGDLLLIEVWDDGHGIEPDLTTRIFEPFFTTKAPGHGLGLGLDTVNRIIRKHRGYVTVQSSPGATCFQVRLPVQQLQAY
jgi:signal transduction histidine kinase